MNTRWLDDLSPGMRVTTGGVTFTEAGIVDFAYQHDPQPFHVDAVAAAGGGGPPLAGHARLDSVGHLPPWGEGRGRRVRGALRIGCPLAEDPDLARERSTPRRSGGCP